MSPERWQNELEKAGFDGLDAMMRDAEEPHQLNAVMVAKTKPRVMFEKNVILLHDDEACVNEMA